MDAKPVMKPRLPIVSIALVFAIALAWVLTAMHFHLPVLASQKSSLLLQVGALNGIDIERGQWWRLLTSQFLHVHFAHMLFNLCAIFALAMAIERSAGRSVLALVYLLGGAIGQYASVLLNPELVSSGASQAMMVLCGFALIGHRRFSIARYAPIFAVTIAAIQFALDVHVSGAIKPGHSFGFAAGLFFALGMAAFQRRQSVGQAAPI